MLQLDGSVAVEVRATVEFWVRFAEDWLGLDERIKDDDRCFLFCFILAYVFSIQVLFFFFFPIK